MTKRKLNNENTPERHKKKLKLSPSPRQTRLVRKQSLNKETSNSVENLLMMFKQAKQATAEFGIIARMQQIVKLVKQHGMIFNEEPATPLLRNITNVTRRMVKQSSGLILNDKNWCMSLNIAWILGIISSNRPVHLVLDPSYLSKTGFSALLNNQGKPSITAMELTYLMDNGYILSELKKSRYEQPEVVVFKKASKYAVSDEQLLQQLQLLPSQQRKVECMTAVDRFIRSHCSAFPKLSI